MAETAREALDRVARVMADRIADDADLRTADQLQPGNMVKVAGEWYVFREFDARGRVMWVQDSGEAPPKRGLSLLTVRAHGFPVSESERFVWHEGQF